jgi:RHS repeat-associated protein
VQVSIVLSHIEISIILPPQYDFEITDHLGNVRAVVSGAATTIVGTERRADIVSLTDYYPFGMVMPGRNFTSDKYRMGYNGKEKDEEWDAAEYGFRMYNAKIGRFFSVDPIERKYPELSPYQYASNRVIDGVDWDGLEFRKSPGCFHVVGGSTNHVPDNLSLVFDSRALPAYFENNQIYIKTAEDLQFYMTSGRAKTLKKADPRDKTSSDTYNSQATGQYLNQLPSGSKGGSWLSFIGDAYVLADQLHPRTQAKLEVKMDVNAARQAIELVTNAYKIDNLIPKEIIDECNLYKNIINWVYDGSVPYKNSEDPQEKNYNQIIITLGEEIYKYRDAINKGTYFVPDKVLIPTPTQTLDRGKDYIKIHPEVITRYRATLNGLINIFKSKPSVNMPRFRARIPD